MTPSISSFGSRLLINENPLQVLPSLAEKVGLNEAIILQQVHYWLNPVHNKNFVEGRHWVYNSYEEWQQQFPFWSKDTIKRAITSLEKRKMIITQKFNEDKFDHRKWYSISYESLQALERCTDRSVQNAPIDGRVGASFDEGKMPRSMDADCPHHYKEQRLLSEITAETTTHANVRENISDAMLEVWNKTILPLKPVQMTPSRSLRLKLILEKHFHMDIFRWKNFCEGLIQSSFLMGKGPRGWRVTLDWILDRDNLQKVLEGNYKNVAPQNNPELAPSPEESDLKAKKYIESIENSDLKKLSEGLKEKFGAATFLSWFTGITISFSCSDDLVKFLSISFPSRFKKEYVERHFKGKVIAVAQAVFPPSKFQWIEYGILASRSEKTSSEFSSCSPDYISGAKAESCYEARSFSPNLPETFLSGNSQASFSEKEQGSIVKMVGQDEAEEKVTMSEKYERKASAISNIQFYDEGFSQNNSEVV